MTRWLLCNLFGVCVVLMSATQDLKCQALREILLVGLDSGSAADHLFRSARDELQPSVRVVPIDGDLSQYPWPSPLRSGGTIVVLAKDHRGSEKALPPHLPRIALTAFDEETSESLSVRVVPNEERTMEWVKALTVGQAPCIQLVGGPSVPASIDRLESISQPDFLSARTWNARSTECGGLLMMSRDLRTLSLTRVLEVAKERGLPVLTDDRNVWALGASAARLSDLKTGGPLLAHLMKRVSEGKLSGGFEAPSTTMVRESLIPSGLPAPALRAWRAADQLLIERVP
jgi:hypothetical protein